MNSMTFLEKLHILFLLVRNFPGIRYSLVYKGKFGLNLLFCRNKSPCSFFMQILLKQTVRVQKTCTDSVLESKLGI